ncbi:hypothetical protein GLOIN_2v1481003 [Rhizophagus clarus]|uniref:Uncharacterized protein n=1 Tax=Rhizophagus clarus TaxID=94130 RepID=A0A8H3QZE5_9GLOM|nr:hypothetical protein GLOIN_2v1481003 [Rhizophagus clarus]
MVRKDKKNRICECYGKTLATPQKLCQHYSSTKNQCSLPSENNNNQRRINTPKVTRPIRSKSPRPRSPSLVPAPVVHTKGKDRRKEKVTPTLIPEPELEKELPKTKTVITSSKPGEVERQDAHDRNARKSGKHLRTWADDEARKNDQEDPEAGPGPSTQTHALAPLARKGLAPIPQDKVQDIHFEECPVEENPAYAFNVPVFGHEYAESPYIPQLISVSRPKIKEVLQTELYRKIK